SSRRRHTRSYGDWSSDVCSSDLPEAFVSNDDVTKALNLSDDQKDKVKTISADYRKDTQALRPGGGAGGAGGRPGGGGGAGGFDQIGRASCRERGMVGGVRGRVVC